MFQSSERWDVLNDLQIQMDLQASQMFRERAAPDKVLDQD